MSKVVASRPPILLATRSDGKLKELRPLFDALRVPVMDLEELGLPYEEDEDAIERFPTFEENALAKARYFYEVSGGIATVADDSGLEVIALAGAPGVRSKRWASDRGAGLAAAGATATDAANNAVLVRAMTGVSDRRAKYVCAAAYAGLGREIVERGEAVGDIVDAPRGTQGFGYDPYFLAAELGRTFGEATIEEKAMVSHRARAFRALLAAIMQTA
ncbi:MAG: non-canonical purine NTP pyrophosphatase [Gemmatimonadales bacterium]